MAGTQPFKGDPHFRNTDFYGAVTYLPPDRVEYHERDVDRLPTKSKVFRVVVTAIFVVLAVIEAVAAVHAAVNVLAIYGNPGPDPHFAAALSTLIVPIALGLLFLVYPVVNLVRLVRARSVRARSAR